MFDIGFAELLVIAVVGLLVIGPNRLPETIRAMALWLGRARRTYTEFKRDLEQEIGADDIRRELRNEEIMAQLKETQQQLEQSANSDYRAAADTPPPDSKPTQTTPTRSENDKSND